MAKQTFKKSNPDLKGCKCFCGKKYKALTNITWDAPNPGADSHFVLPFVTSGNTDLGFLLARDTRRIITQNTAPITFVRDTTFDIDLPPANITQSIIIKSGLIPVLVFKNGLSFSPSITENLDSHVHTFSDTKLSGDFTLEHYDVPGIDPPQLDEVFEGGGFISEDNEIISPWTSKSGGSFAEFIDDFIIPDELLAQCARIDLYLVTYYTQTVTEFLGVPFQFTNPAVWIQPDNSGRVDTFAERTKVHQYYSSICKIDTVLNPNGPVTLGLHYSDRFRSLIPSTIQVTFDFPEVDTEPEYIYLQVNGSTNSRVVREKVPKMPESKITINYALDVQELEEGDTGFEELKPC